MCEKPGSPFKVIRTEEWNYHVESVRQESDIAQARIEELEAELATLRAKEASPIDEETLVNSLVGVLDARYARKAGRKPAGTAA